MPCFCLYLTARSSSLVNIFVIYLTLSGPRELLEPRAASSDGFILFATESEPPLKVRLFKTTLGQAVLSTFIFNLNKSLAFSSFFNLVSFTSSYSGKSSNLGQSGTLSNVILTSFLTSDFCPF